MHAAIEAATRLRVGGTPAGSSVGGDADFEAMLDAVARDKGLSGDALTLADFSLGAAMNIAEMAHYPIEPYAEIRRWHAGLAALPSWQKTLAQCAPPKAAAA